MTDLRNYTLRLTGTTDLITETCFKCGVLFAMTADFHGHRYRRQDSFYCPSGHAQHYVGKSDADKLKDANVRETALKDQLGAAVREAESARAALLRDRHRFANGVCPCCNRSFDNVRRHMASKHPEFDVAQVKTPVTRSRCSCGRSFNTPRGLRVHQGHMRHTGWETSKSTYSQHLTKV